MLLNTEVLIHNVSTKTEVLSRGQDTAESYKMVVNLFVSVFLLIKHFALCRKALLFQRSLGIHFKCTVRNIHYDKLSHARTRSDGNWPTPRRLST